MYRGYVLLMAPVYVLVVVVGRIDVGCVEGITTKLGPFGASPIHCAIRSVVRVKKLVMYE